MHVLRMLQFGGCLGVFCDAPDANAGAGSHAQGADAGDMPDAGDPSDGDAGVEANADAGDDAIDDDSLLLGDEDDEQLNTRSPEEQLRAMRKANRRLRRNAIKHRSTLDRLKGVDLDSVFHQARQFQELERNIARNPRLRAVLQGGTDTPDTREGRRASPEPELPPLPTTFTADTLGFDPDESPANKAAANLFAHVARMSKQLEQLSKLQPTVENLDRTFTTQRTATERAEWQGALSSFETELRKAIPGNELVVTLARDAMIGAYQSRGQHGKSAKQIVQGYIDRLVKAGQITKNQGQRVSAATQSRMANHNSTLPKSPAGGGTPSSAQGNQRPTLKDVHARLRTGQIGPR